MRKLGSALIILLLLTAYGRCVADQFGLLQTTGTPCCQVTCDQVNHCTPPEGQVSSKDHEDQHDHAPGDHPCNPDLPGGHDRNQQEPEDSPTPCQLCFILDSDSMIHGESIKVPAPLLFELSPLFYITSWDNQLQPGHPVTALDHPPSDYPESHIEQRSHIRRIVAKTTPVRGPSIA